MNRLTNEQIAWHTLIHAFDCSLLIKHQQNIVILVLKIGL